ncbi:MAG: IS5 family transposase [Halobacteria archaeon]
MSDLILDEKKRVIFVVQTKTSRFTKRCVWLAKKVCDKKQPAVNKGVNGYSDWLILSLHGLKQYLDHTYRKLMDVLKEMSRITRYLGVKPENLPHYSTVCNSIQQINTIECRKMLKFSTNFQENGDIQAIDASGFDRSRFSNKYRKRTGYKFKAIKTSLLVDCKTNQILDLSISTKQPHDTKAADTLLKKNLDKINILTADKGYDSGKLRKNLRSNNIRPVIKHREFTSLDKAHNARIDDDVYHQRSNVESVFSSLKQRYNDRLLSKKWYNQYKEIVLKCVVKNIEDSIKN